MTAIEIQQEIKRLKAKWGLNGDIRQDIPRCRQCGMILIVDEFGDYVCPNNDIHSTLGKRDDICYTIISKEGRKDVKRAEQRTI